MESHDIEFPVSENRQQSSEVDLKKGPFVQNKFRRRLRSVAIVAKTYQSE